MLKDQVVALTLELEDKSKIETLLKRKLDIEKGKLESLEKEINEQFQVIIKVLNDVPRNEFC